MACAYAVLTHEELIDLTWQDSIVPMLLSQYPNLTPAQLKVAHSYAYGGCVIQDIGYYPDGDRFFSDLTHYVRSGDFVVNLFRNAHNANELAFAIGALSHYIGDSIGHPEATNIAVPIEFPGLKARYGRYVNYAEGEHQHVQTEFGFDVDQIVHHRFAPLAFKRHIGLRVPVHQLSLAFYQTYGVSDFISHRHHPIKVPAYRFAVHTFIPRIGEAVAILHRHREPVEPDTPDVIAIEKQMAAVAAENHWDRYRKKPSFETYALAGLLFILPKVGPLALVNVKGPTPQTEADYMRSLVLSTHALRSSLRRFTPPKSRRPDPYALAPDRSVAPVARLPVDTHQERQQEDFNPNHPLPDRDLDTGHVVEPGGYPLTDQTFAALLHHLTATPKVPIPQEVKQDLQAYYSNPNAPISTKLNTKRWAQVQADLKVLATMTTIPQPQSIPSYAVDQDTGDE